MKRKIYFLCTSLLEIVLSIYTIINSNKIFNEMLRSIDMLPESIKNTALDLYKNNGNYSIILSSVVCIIFNLIIIYIALKNNIIKKRKLILTLSIISLFLSTIDFVSYISIINILIICMIKDTELLNEIKNDNIPILNNSITKKDIILSLICILIYSSQFCIIFINYNKFILQIISDIVILICILLLTYNKLKDEIKLFISNFKQYMNYIFPRLGKMYLIYIFVAIIVSIINKNRPINQQSLEALPYLYLIPAAIIWAPIVEETIFRRCLRNFIKNDKIFIIVSALTFGLLHAINENNIISILIVSLPYVTLGGYLSYIYVKTNNMISNIFSHAFINTVALILMLITI